MTSTLKTQAFSAAALSRVDQVRHIMACAMIAIFAAGSSAAQGGERIVESAPDGHGSFIVSDKHGGDWQDVEKSSKESIDDIWCFIAGPSNILAWSGWGHVTDTNLGTKPLVTTDDVWENYKGYWKKENDGAEDAYDALQWFFEGKPDDEENVPAGGGNHHPDVAWPGYGNDKMGDVYVGISRGDMRKNKNVIAEYLQAGYAFALQLKGVEKGRHVITLWGYSYDKTDKDKITGYYLTNSDDDKRSKNPPDRLYHRKARYDADEGRWILENAKGEDHYYIWYCYGLKARAVTKKSDTGSGLTDTDTPKRESRILHNAKGRAVTAEIHEVNGNTLIGYIKGKRYEIAIDSLSEEDQQFLKSWEKK